VKFANSAVDCKCIGHIAEKIGMYGFMASGPAEAALPNKTKDCEFIACTAIDVGYNDIEFANKAGFIVRVGDFDLTYPQGIRFVDCKTLDRQAVKTTKYGFYNEPVIDTVTLRPNEVLNGYSEGHLTATQAGFHRNVCRVSGTGAVSLTHGVGSTIAWNVDKDDTMEMHNVASDTDEIFIRKAGRYRVKAKLVFAGGSTAGYRRIQLANTDGIVFATNAFAPVSAEITVCTLDEEIDLTVGQRLRIWGEQTSGGALNVNRPDSYFHVELLRAA
jgi:hypothetical protein